MKILRKPEATEMTGLSAQSLWRLSRDGKFPRLVQLGPQSVGYVEAEILEWIEARVAERDARGPQRAA